MKAATGESRKALARLRGAGADRNEFCREHARTGVSHAGDFGTA